jgi:hypothetical protein
MHSVKDLPSEQGPKLVISAVLVLLVASRLSPLDAQGKDGAFELIQQVDLSGVTDPANPGFIGEDPSAVAWDGEDLYVAGRHKGTGFGTVAIVRIAAALANPTAGTRFGAQQSVPIGHGYSGLDIRDLGGIKLASSFDAAAVHPDGIAVWDASGTRLWSQAARATCGPGFDAAKYGNHVAWTSDYSPTGGMLRRALNRHPDGSVLYDLNTGFPFGFFAVQVRDIDHAPSGDYVWRDQNAVFLSRRESINFAWPEILTLPPTGYLIYGQNVAYIDKPGKHLVAYNDRHSIQPSQAFTDVVQVVKLNGRLVDDPFPGFGAAPGNAYYDFSWDSPSRTLAILDQTNRAVYIFKHYDDTQTFCTAKSGLACGMPIIRHEGTASASATSGFVIESRPALADRLGVLIYSQQQAPGIVFHGGTLCLGTTGLHRAGPTSSLGTAGNCDGVFQIDMNAFAQGLWQVPGAPGMPTYTPQPFLQLPGQTVFCQFWGRDSVSTASFVSGGLSYTVGP